MSWVDRVYNFDPLSLAVPDEAPDEALEDAILAAHGLADDRGQLDLAELRELKRYYGPGTDERDALEAEIERRTG